MKACCYICGERVTSDSERVQCGLCTQKKLKFLDILESESGIRIINTNNYKTAMMIRKKDKEDGIEPHARIPLLRPEPKQREYTTPEIELNMKLRPNRGRNNVCD